MATPLPAGIFCCCDCVPIGTDDFNRANANPVTGNWTEVSGDWEILSNTLNNITEGILVTSLRQSTPLRTGAGYSNTFTVTLLETGGTTEWHLISNYQDANNFYWIKIHNDGGYYPVFYIRSGGTDTLIMDKTTHPLGSAFTFVSGALVVTVCTSELEWSISPGNSEGRWQTCTGSPVTSLPADPDEGLVGFKKGRFDDWGYYKHWETQTNCPGCNCTCYIDDDNVSCIPEELVVTLNPASGPYDTCPTPEAIVFAMKQQVPVISTIPTPPTFGSSRKTPRKYVWYCELLHGEHQSPPINGAWPWLILVCDTFKGQAYLLVREYPDESITTDPPTSGGLMPYWAAPDTDLVDGAKRFDIGLSDCDPLILTFPGLTFPRSAVGQCGIYGTVYDVVITV